MKVEVLRCWKSKLNNKVYGEYYINDSIHHEKHLVFQNGDDIKVIAHWVDKKVKDCVSEVTKEVIDAIHKTSENYLLAKKQGG